MANDNANAATAAAPLDEPRVTDESQPTRMSMFRRRKAGTEEVLRPAVRPPEPVRVPYNTTRLFSLCALGVLASGMFYVGSAVYDAFGDSFVTPIVLSPDSDLVLPSKLSLSRLLADKSALEIRIREAQSITTASDTAIDKLRGLQALVSQSLSWSTWVTTEAQSSSSADLQALGAQKTLLQQRISNQRAYVDELERSLAAGLVHKSDVLREQSTLSQLRIEALENEREAATARARLKQSSFARRALSEREGVLTPEMVQQRDQLVRIELELLKLEADGKAREDELRAAREELARTDQLITQMKQRPVFRAIEAEQNVAFVPYPQLEGVHRGASVYACAVWGFFSCSDVGKVVDVLPGEVSHPDPWGAPARGQYALLALQDGKAAQARLLRVRSNDESERTPAVVRASLAPETP